MAELLLCEPLELYNLLNCGSGTPRLAQDNFLCLVDARDAEEYNESHIITARNVKKSMNTQGSQSCFLLPESVEIESLEFMVVYDGNTSCLQQSGQAVECAQDLARTRVGPVHVVRGGFQRFSALYPFLRTQKILYTIMELESLTMYPAAIIEQQLYVGEQNKAVDPVVRRDLKITAVVSICQSQPEESTKENQSILNIPVGDSVTADLYSSFERICSFIASHINTGSCILVVSSAGLSRCSAAVIAFLMYHLRCTLKEAWEHTLKCKHDMRPNSGFILQLSDWELHTRGEKVTDISEL